MYTKKEREANKVLKNAGFGGFRHNPLCYNCKKFNSTCDGMSGKSNAPCVKFVQERNIEKAKYALAKDMMYQSGNLYDGKKNGVLLVACELYKDNITKVFGYKKLYVNTFEEAVKDTNELKALNPYAEMLYYISSDGKELDIHQGMDEILFTKSDRDITEKFKKIGLDITKL